MARNEKMPGFSHFGRLQPPVTYKFKIPQNRRNVNGRAQKQAGGLDFAPAEKAGRAKAPRFLAKKRGA
jgi:hypothetical protein